MAMAYPEAVCIGEQMAEVLAGKEIAEVSSVDIADHGGSWRLGSVVQDPDTFRERLQGGAIVGVDRVANSVFLNTTTGYALALGYLSGKVLYHASGERPPPRHCLCLRFADQSQLSVVISLWGLVRVLDQAERGQYVSHWYGQATEPNARRYTWKGFRAAAKRVEEPKLSAKKFLHAFEPGYYVSGLDAGYAMEILHRARVHPRRTLASLSDAELRACFEAVSEVTREAVEQGGRCSEVDLFGQPGRFAPHVCRERLGEPCLECGTPMAKLSFEGGTSYLCPTCQPEGGG